MPDCPKDLLFWSGHLLLMVAAGIDLPFPTQQILFHDRTESTDGDRANQREGWPVAKGDNPKPRKISDSLRQLASSSNNDNGNNNGDRA